MKLKLMILLFMTSLACSSFWPDETPVVSSTPPQVSISSPTVGDLVMPKLETTIQSTSVDLEGIAKVELYINGALERIDANTNTTNSGPFIVAQPWTPPVKGFYVIQVKSYDTTGAIGESEPLTLEVTEIELVPQSTITPTPISTPVPTEIPTLPPTPTVVKRPTLTVEPTETGTPTATWPPGLVLPTPSATPTLGQFEDTGLRPEGRFGDLWANAPGAQQRLGYPVDIEYNDRTFAAQRFERGDMFWLENPDGIPYIWAIDGQIVDVHGGATWNVYQEEWDSVEFYNCLAATENGEIGPRYGFGKLWCDRQELIVRLGQPVDYEIGNKGNPPFAQVQFFQGGVMLYNPLTKDTFMLFNQGDWLRFAE
ncbi:Ig-like domain-containing protein [Anaerolineales bacterium HSG6]|nr:Ig-like domain-containing protein [Anaerolineales bacterium HSG6]